MQKQMILHLPSITSDMKEICKVVEQQHSFYITFVLEINFSQKCVMLTYNGFL